MFKRIVYVSVFVMVLILALQSVSASEVDFNMDYSNDFNLDDSVSLSSADNIISASPSSNLESSLQLSDSSIENGDDIGETEDVGSLSDEALDNDGDDNPDDNPDVDSGDVEEDNRNKTIINADSINVVYGKEGQLKINLTDENGVGLSDKTILVQVNGNESNVITDSNGLATFKYSNAVGVYNVFLSFSGDEFYASSDSSAKITISKASTKLKVPSVKSYLNYQNYVNITLTDSNGLALANKKVYFVLSGIRYNATTNGAGVAKVKIPNNICNLNITVKFDGDENYSACSKTSKVVISKAKTHLFVPVVKSYITRNTYLKITLKDICGTALANKLVKVVVGKKTYKLYTDEKGQAKLKFDKKFGTFNCKVTFAETKSFYGSSNSSKVSISKTPTVIKVPNLKFNSSEHARLRINLTDIDGKAMANRVVSLSIPALKKVFKLKTNAKGIASLRINSAYSYNIVVKYAGDKNHVAKSVKSKFVVKKVYIKFNDVLNVAVKLKNYISENKSMPSKIKYKNYTFTSPQISYLMAVAIKHISQKNKNDIILINASAPSKSVGEIYDTVYKKDFLKIAKNVAGPSTFNRKNPSYVKYSFYKVPYKVYVASFSRILDYYKETKKLPNYALFTKAEYAKVSNSSKYTFYLTTDNIAGKKTDLRMLKSLAKTLRSKGYQAVIVGIGPDIHNKAYKYGCTGKKSVLLCCFGGVDVGCIEEWTGDLAVGDGVFVNNYNGAHVLGLWYSKPYGASASLNKRVGRAWDANYGHPLANPAKYMSQHNISYIQVGTVTAACNKLKAGKMGGPKLIK